MTAPPHPSRMDESEFEKRLTRLIDEARERNAPLYGSFAVRSPDPNDQDYEVQITPIVDRIRTGDDIGE